MAAQRPSCRPASQTQTGLASMGIHQHSQRGKSGHYQKKPIAAPRSLAPATAPNSPSDWPRPTSDEAIPTLGGAARVGDSKPPPPWVQTSETRASKKDPSSPFFSFCHLSPLGPYLCHSGPGRPRRLAAVALPGTIFWQVVLFLETFITHHSQIRGRPRMRIGEAREKGITEMDLTCPGYTLNQRSSPQDQTILVAADQNIPVISTLRCPNPPPPHESHIAARPTSTRCSTTWTMQPPAGRAVGRVAVTRPT